MTDVAANRPMAEPLGILADDCTVTDEDEDETRRERGNVVTITHPDDTEEPLVDQPSQGSLPDHTRFARAKRLSLGTTKVQA